MNAYRNRIDEQSDHAFYALDVRRTARYDAAEYDIRRVVVGLQHKTPGRLNQRIDGDMILPRCPLNPFTQLPAQFKIQINGYIAVRFVRLLFLRQPCLLLASGQVMTPKVRCFIQVLLIQPFDIRAKRRYGSKLGLPVFMEREVAVEHFLDHEEHAPAVHQNMMVTPYEVERPGSGTQNRHPH